MFFIVSIQTRSFDINMQNDEPDGIRHATPYSVQSITRLWKSLGFGYGLAQGNMGYTTLRTSSRWSVYHP